MKLALPIALVALIVCFSAVNGGDPKPCDTAWSKCRLKYHNPRNCEKKNEGIQAGQCWSSIRMKDQKAAYFIPFKLGEKSYDSQGGPYGICLACNWLPKPTDLEVTQSYNDLCFFWDARTPVQAPGEKTIAMPPICPSNLRPCPIANWFEPNGPLAYLANVKPDFKGIWFPPKDANFKPLFCNGLGLGCDTPTMLQLQLAHLADMKCNVKTCRQPVG